MLNHTIDDNNGWLRGTQYPLLDVCAKKIELEYDCDDLNIDPIAGANMVQYRLFKYD